MFDATASKYRDIQFERINVDSHDDRCAQYKVSGIPHVVCLDGSNNVVKTMTSWSSPEEFAGFVGH